MTATGSSDPHADRLEAVSDALHQLGAQAAALEELSEQISLGLHSLEIKVDGLVAASRPPAPAPVERAPRSTDVEGARLVALNMALNGDSREQTDRYLAENYEIEDRARLLDEVYAAIAG